MYMEKKIKTLCDWCKRADTCEEKARVEELMKGIAALVGDNKPICFGYSYNCFWHKSVYGNGYSGDKETDNVY